jgi:hypothetical protein
MTQYLAAGTSLKNEVEIGFGEIDLLQLEEFPPGCQMDWVAIDEHTVHVEDDRALFGMPSFVKARCHEFTQTSPSEFGHSFWADS